MFACLYQPPHADAPPSGALVGIAHDFSPRYQKHQDDLVVIDVAGLERMFLRRPGPDAREGAGVRTSASGSTATPVWTTIGEELRRAIAARGIRVHVAMAGTQTAAMVLAHTRPGLTVIQAGAESEALAPVALGILEKINAHVSTLNVERSSVNVEMLRRWGLRTLGDLALLPAADLVARMGRDALAWQAFARGEDLRPLIPTLDEERFDSTLELEWPIDGLEPLSFVLTRLLEPLSTRLERRDRGAAILHLLLGLVTKDTYARRLELPTPMRDVRALRTLALLDLEAHPPAAAIDRVTIVIDPTPGRVLQHALFARAHPTPEQISTLLARLGALMGQDRIGAPAPVDTDRPGAFEMHPFATEHGCHRGARGRSVLDTREGYGQSASPRGGGAPRQGVGVGPHASEKAVCVSALRRCRQPVPARVAVGAEGRPVRVTTDRHGFNGGAVVQCAGPWRTSGHWWESAWENKAGGGPWNRDEWDVALSDGAVYRVFQDRETDGWFIDAIVD